MNTAREVWQNTYGGLDCDRSDLSWSRWVIGAFRDVLPPAVISPTCAKKGHDWSAPVAFHPEAPVRGCLRCAKRGLVVLETRALATPVPAVASKKDTP